MFFLPSYPVSERDEIGTTTIILSWPNIRLVKYNGARPFICLKMAMKARKDFMDSSKSQNIPSKMGNRPQEVRAVGAWVQPELFRQDFGSDAVVI